MIIDAATRLSDGQAITAGTQLSTNVYDTTIGGVPRGGALRLLLQVSATFTGGTSLSAQLVQSDDPAFGSFDVLLGSATFGESTLTIGAKILDAVMPLVQRRYLAIQYFSTGTHTSGSVVCDLLRNTDSNVTFSAWTGL